MNLVEMDIRAQSPPVLSKGDWGVLLWRLIRIRLIVFGPEGEKLDSVPLVLTSRTEEKKMKNNEEEVFTPEDKENFSPTTHKSMRKFAVLKEITNSSPGKSPPLKLNCSPNNDHENFVSPLSNKENYSPRSRQKQKTANCASAN